MNSFGMNVPRRIFVCTLMSIQDAVSRACCMARIGGLHSELDISEVIASQCNSGDGQPGTTASPDIKFQLR